jgi:DNA-binding transcriptional MerR regulator
MSEMRIGELARATGVSVRALRHYEQLGLLKAEGRTPSNHRLYGQPALERLYRICALKNLGLSLAEINQALEAEGLGDLMQRQLVHVEREMQRLGAMQQRLRRLATYLDQPLSSQKLVELIQALVAMERYFTPAQLESLRQRRQKAGSQEGKWRELGSALRAHMEAGTPPTDPEVQALAERRRQYVLEFSAGDPEILATLQRLRKEKMPAGGLAGWDAQLMEYADRAQNP